MSLLKISALGNRQEFTLDNGVVASVSMNVMLSRRHSYSDGGRHRDSSRSRSRRRRRRSRSTDSTGTRQRGSTNDGGWVGEGKRAGSSSSSRRRRRSRSENLDDSPPAQRVKSEPISSEQVWLEPSYSPDNFSSQEEDAAVPASGAAQEEGGEEEEGKDEEEEEEDLGRCYNCDRVLTDHVITDDMFVSWQNWHGNMGFHPSSQQFCHGDCHKSALMWTIQAMMPQASINELQAAVMHINNAHIMRLFDSP
jgi:hypothetical protein